MIVEDNSKQQLEYIETLVINKINQIHKRKTIILLAFVIFLIIAGLCNYFFVYKPLSNLLLNLNKGLGN